VNEAIRVREVRLIGVNGENHGIVPTRKALEIARDAGLDLVEVAPDARPPVCRIMDYGKYKYMQKKREQEAKKKLHQIEVKEVRVRPKIERHDLDIKMKRARNFLEEGNKVQFTMLFRGREITFTTRAREMLLSIAEELSDISRIERHPTSEGRRMIMVLVPLKTGN